MDFEEREKKFSEHKVLWPEPLETKVVVVETVILPTIEEQARAEKEELLHGPRFKKKKVNEIPPIIIEGMANVRNGIIDPLLEKCLTKNMKIRHIERLWERSRKFLDHPFYKLSFKYYEILLAPGDKGAKFNYCLEAQRKRTLKALGAGCTFADMSKKEWYRDFNPIFTIRVYFDIKKVHIEVVDQTNLHHMIVFPLHPKSKFIELHTKEKFEKKSPVGECSTKMTYLLNNVKIFALETETNYYWKIKIPMIHTIIQYQFLRRGEIFLF